MTIFFDEHGRCVPTTKAGNVQPKVRRYFRCDQPAINLETIYLRSKENLGTPETSLESFKTKVEELLNTLRNDTAVCNILKGTYVPFILPRRAKGDIGKDIEKIYLPAVKKAFTANFKDYEFVNHQKSSIADKLYSTKQTRHPALLNKLSTQDVIGIFFPALDGYSLPAARNQVVTLPAQFSLAGGADTCAAFVSCPDLLLRREGYPPLLWFGALESNDNNEGFHLEAYGYNLTFNRRVHLGNADEYWANGLVYSF